MATSTSSVADMAHHIERIVDKPSWQTDSAIKGDLMRVLGKLTTVRVDVDLLKSTGIGKWVKKLTKYDDEVVRGYSSSLTEKWKAQVGVPNEKVTSSAPRDSVSPSSARQSTGDADRLEQARKKLQEKYASEKAKREARTVQVLSKPMTKRRGTTISAAPSRSTVGAARSKLASMSIQRRTVAAPATSSASSSMARRPLSASAASGLSSMNSQRPSTAPPQSSDDARLRKRERLLALAKQARQSEGRPSASTMQRAPMGRLQSSDLPSGSTMGSSNRRAVPDKPVDARKAMLDKMFPRVCGVADTTTGSKSSRRAGGSGGAAAANGQASKSKKKPVNYSEGQREVIQWLKGLDVDMSSYASAFFDNGFDSIKLLNEIKPRDLESMVPKTGHQRMIDKALAELKRKHATSAASRPRSASRDHRDRDRDRDRGGSARRRPQSDSYFDSESDDSFVVSDGDEYAPGVITAMLRKGRKRRYSIDSTDSYNMEASYEDIQKEEKRSKLIGDYEDYREELRNKKMLKKGM